MENWCYEKSVINEMARHHKTGEKLPEELFQKILSSKKFRAGHELIG